MAASTIQNIASKPESKSAKKKKTGKSDSVTALAVPAASPIEAAPPAGAADGTYESPYIKELYK